jgi:hypothetical protein
MRKFLLALSTVALVGGAMLASPAVAQDRFDRHDDRRDFDRHDDRRDFHDRGGWHDHDIHRFNNYDFGLWRQGRWFRGPHDGRRGWWWIVGGSWYFYPQPVYPYPDPYRPPVVAGPVPPGPVYYYCRGPAGYYPYVPSCPSAWQVVPAG